MSSVAISSTGQLFLQTRLSSSCVASFGPLHINYRMKLCIKIVHEQTIRWSREIPAHNFFKV